MPPRFVFWTILIDNKPTAFRAREKEELLPTLRQLRRTNKDVVLKWFARGRLWETPEEALAAQRAPKPTPDRRGRDWRPGGQHQDPRAHFREEKTRRNQERRADRFERRHRDERNVRSGPPRGERSPSHTPGEKKPWSGKPRPRTWQKPKPPKRG